MTTQPGLSPAQRRISKLRTQLLIQSPWFGTLALRLYTQETQDLPTMGVDGTTLYFNPEFTMKLEDAECKAVICHEVMHVAMKHIWRLGHRDKWLFNMAGDYAINGILIKAGMKLPKDALYDKRFDGMSAEQIYAILQDEIKQAPQKQQTISTGSFSGPPQDGQGKDKGKGKGKGEGKDKDDKKDNKKGQGKGKGKPEQGGGQPGQGGDDADDDGDQQQGKDDNGHIKPMTETDWEIAVEQATITAQKAGKLPGGIEAIIRAAKSSSTNWVEILRRFVQQTIPKNFSWVHPNRRFIQMGIYVPGIEKENCPAMDIVVDTSGSIYCNPAFLRAFAAECTAILHQLNPEEIRVHYCDTEIRNTEIFTPTDEEVIFRECKGGGGTKFQPAFDFLNASEEKVNCCIYLTDLECFDEPQEPDAYPVLWVTPVRFESTKHRFGERVTIDTACT